MPIERDELLLDGIKEALGLYERSLVWATTAALSGAVIVFRLQDDPKAKVELLWGALSGPVAWIIAQVVYVVFGALAYSALRRCFDAVRALNPDEEILEAIRFYPSLATMPHNFFPFGSALLPLVVTYISWVIEVFRERSGSPWPPLMDSYWLGVFFTALILALPYVNILVRLRELRVWVPNHTPVQPGTQAHESH